MNTKQCIACKEEILEKALKCKHCRQIQAQAANLPNKPAFNYLILGFLIIGIVWIGYLVLLFSLEEPPEPDFTIEPPNMLLSESEKGLNIRCIGKITNPSAKRWSNFSLQAKFKNADGHTIDVIYSEPKVTIYPRFSFEGYVSGSGSALKTEYASCELSVTNAVDY